MCSVEYNRWSRLRAESSYLILPPGMPRDWVERESANKTFQNVTECLKVYENVVFDGGGAFLQIYEGELQSFSKNLVLELRLGGGGGEN